MSKSWKNQFSVSYGLVVITKSNQVVMIKRKVPYCVQDFLMKKGKNLDIFNYHELFYKQYLPYIDLNMQFDYYNFYCGLPFEDEFDFPHGQLSRKNHRNVLSTAIREFQEETGLMLGQNWKIINVKTIKFFGLDNCLYNQLFFIISVDDVRWEGKKVDGLYETFILDVKKAKEVLLEQQKVKVDYKYTLLPQ